MTRIALPIAALAAIVCFDASAGHAQTIGDAPWCAVTDTGAGRLEFDCEYYSIEECTPNVIAGNRGFCQVNPDYRAAPESFPRHRHRRHHPSYR